VTEVAEVMARPITQRLLRDEPLMRFAYTGLDGAPRVIPLAYRWDGTSLLFWTTPLSARLPAPAGRPAGRRDHRRDRTTAAGPVRQRHRRADDRELTREPEADRRHDNPYSALITAQPFGRVE
jgi:hypothetical protein